MNSFAEFLLNLEKALALLPNDKSRLRMLNLLVAGLSAHVSDESANRIMGRALDEAQDFKERTLQLVVNR